MYQQRIINRVLVALASFAIVGRASAQVVSFIDGIGDATPRLTDLGADGPYNSEFQRLPDLLAIELCSFEPDAPQIDRFTGSVDQSGMYIRIDVMLDGLINPTGEIDFDNEQAYAPDAYGPHPMVGYIEFDIDHNEDTGGEVEYPEFRYLATTARFGGLPSEARFDDRAARFEQEIDANLNTQPFVERSGEEFHIALIDENPSSVDVIFERPGGVVSIFEAGETWWVSGEFFHRAHVYDDLMVMCGSGNNRYEPELIMQYTHDELSDITTISLVIPKTNAGAARFKSPSQTVQSNDGCDGNQYSIEEAVMDMIVSASVADFFTRQLPEFQLLAAWEYQSAAPSLDVTNWRVAANLGTAYLPDRVDGAEIIWSDVYPNIINGDVNGDAVVDTDDEAAIGAFIATYDGEMFYDSDGNDQNGSVALWHFGPYYCVYDVNYDGVVNGSELVADALPGDFNLDGSIDGRDIEAIVTALIDPVAYATAYPTADLLAIGDLNNDEAFDLADVDGFIALLLGS